MYTCLDTQRGTDHHPIETSFHLTVPNRSDADTFLFEEVPWAGSNIVQPYAEKIITKSELGDWLML